MNFDLLIKRAKEEGITEIEVYYQHTEGLNISLFNGKVDKNVSNKTTGIAVRGIFNGQMGYVSSEKLDDDNIEFILKKLKDNASVLTSKEKSFIFSGSDSYPEVKEYDPSFLMIDPQVKIDLLKKLEKTIKEKDVRITSVGNCMYGERKVETLIQNSKGLNLKKSNSYCYVYASAVAKDNSDVKSAGDYMFVNDFKEIDIDKLASNIVNKAVGLLNATPIESKKYPVILENTVFASILGAFQSMFSGEAVIKKITLLDGKIGEKIASEKLTIVDDPLNEDAFVQDAFDDEGVCCYRKEIISKGVFKTFLHNLKTANALNTKSTGNGFKMSLNSPIGVRRTNLVIEKGDTSLDDMIKSIDHGVLITQVAGIHSGVNPVSGEFSLQASGYLILDHKIKRPVTLIVIAGNFLDMLNNIEIIGDDLKFNESSIAAPSVKISSLQVSGT